MHTSNQLLRTSPEFSNSPFSQHFNIRLAKEQSPCTVIKAETHLATKQQLGRSASVRRRRTKRGNCGFGTRYGFSVGGRRLTAAFLAHAHAKTGKLNGGQNGDGSRAKRRPSHPRSHSLSLALCRSRPKRRTTNSTRTLGGFSLAGSLDAAAQRARLHHPNCACPAPPPVRRPSRIHAGCIEFIPGCRQPRGARSFFLQTPPHSHTLGDFQTVTVLAAGVGLGLATLAQKHGGAA